MKECDKVNGIWFFFNKCNELYGENLINFVI